MISSGHLAALNHLLPLLRRAYWTDGRAELPISFLAAEELDLLPDFTEVGCLQATGSRLIDTMPWADIEKLLIKLAARDEGFDRAAISASLQSIPLRLDANEKLLLLSGIGLVERREDGVAGTQSRYEREMDNALSFIEERDALQVRYGILEPFMTIRDFVLDYPFPRDPLYITQRMLLWRLYLEKHILLLQTGTDTHLWQVRSRTAEIVRILASLRKRQAAHRKSYQDTRLVRDVRWEMRRRTIPERNIPFEKMLVDVVNDTVDPQHTSWNDPVWQKVQKIYLDVMAARYSMVSQFQARSTRQIFGLLRQRTSDARGVVITTATGSGKTLAFAAPMLLQATLEKALGNRAGVKAICIYPRQKLAENQMAEFVRLLHDLNRSLRFLGLPTLTIGVDYQGTPHDLAAFKPPDQPKDGQILRDQYDRFWAWHEGAGAWRCPYADCPVCHQPLVLRQGEGTVWLECTGCGERLDHVLPTKALQRTAPPDILIITTESLNRRLGDPSFCSLFGDERFTVPSMVMLDEIHLYTGVDGAQVALLVRRLLQRLRLAAEVLGRQEAPVVVGLSATVREPVIHLQRLTGLPATSILHEQVNPATDHTRQSGADHYIFVRPAQEEPQPISTLARAAQCLAHNMLQPGDDADAYTVLGFVDSLDIVGRWRRLMEDIEHNEHFAFRNPEKIRQSEDLKNYGPAPAGACSECFQGYPSPNPDCSLFQIGECWWFMRQGGRSDSLRVQSVRSGTPMLAGYDMTIATSVLEVGYDDANIMGVIQFMAPQNVASFVQRKGRGGRGPSDRPISLTVVNPQRANDIHLYRNAHVLTDPLFTKLPLNVENEEVLKVHGIMAFFDYVAFQLRTRPQSSSPWAAKQDVLTEYQRVLRSDWTRFERTYLLPLVGSNPRVVDRVRGRVRDFCQILEQHGRASLAKDLAHELPRNLFSSINLPEVQVYDADSRGAPYSMEMMAIDQAMREIPPGRVTYRFARQRYQAYWQPPMAPDDKTGSGQCSVEGTHKLTDVPIAQIDWRLVPGTLAQLRSAVGEGEQPAKLPLYRPLAVNMRRFSHGSDEHSAWDNWFYCDRCQSFFRRDSLKEHSGHAPAQLADGTRGFPVGFVQVNADTRLLNPDTIFYGSNSSFAQGYWFGPFASLVGSLAFFNKNAGEYMQVHKVSLGSEVWARFQDRPSRSWLFNYTLNGQEVALGYIMYTEGATLRLADTDFLTCDELRSDLRLRLRVAAFCFDIYCACKKPDAPRLLPVTLLVGALLIWYDEAGTNEFGEQLHGERNVWCERMQTLFKRLPDQFPPQHLNAVIEAINDDRFWQDVVVVSFDRRVLRPDPAEERLFINDVFFHSFKHTVRDSVSTVLGAEAGLNLGGWWHASHDFPRMGDRREMSFFEFGLYGIGYMRDWFNKFPAMPQMVWNAVEERMGHCPTGDEEDFIRAVLSLPLENLEPLAKRVLAIRQAGSFRDRQAGVVALDDHMRTEYGLELSDSLRRLLVRLFGQPLELGSGQVIDDWRLYRELNISLMADWDSLAHSPSFEEMEGRAFKVLSNAPARMPTWHQLRSRLSATLPASQVEQRLRPEMGKRLLATCVDGCPDCLHSACELDAAPQRSALLLSRRVLAIALDKLRRPLTVAINDQPIESLAAQIRDCLEQHCVAYLVYTRANASRVAAITSSLLAESIDHDGRSFGVQINGSTYDHIDLANHDVRYRLSLRCCPLESADA